MPIVIHDDRPQILEQLARSQRPLILSHANPDGDTIGSALALCHRLQRLGKQPTAGCADPIPAEFDFLPDVQKFVQTRPANTDLIICVDSSSSDRFGNMLDDRTDIPLLNVDHHITNSGFGDYNYVIGETAATANLIADLLDRMDLEMNADEALCLYTALFTDTGGFRYESSDAESHRMAARFLELGVDPWAVTVAVYESIPWRKVELYRRCLAGIQLCKDGTIACMHVTLQDMQQAGATGADTDGFINYARSIRGVELAIFLREEEPGLFKVSFRSKGRIDVSQICARFGGGGHRNAGGFLLRETDHRKALEMVLEQIE